MTTTVQEFKILSEHEFQQRVRGLIGQPFSGATPSYGGELHLRFGRGQSPVSGWTLGTRVSRWILLSQTGILCRDTDNRDGLRAFSDLGTASVTAVDTARVDRTLMFLFESGHRFVLLPNKPHRSRDDLDLWELFSPDGWWLAVRRDGAVELVPNDMTAADREKRRAAR